MKLIVVTTPTFFVEEDKIINFFEVEIEANESIHNHNAWAYQKKVKN